MTEIPTNEHSRRQSSLWERALARLQAALRPARNPANQRAHPRLPAHGEVEIWGLEADEEGFGRRVNVIDASPKGISVLCPVPGVVGQTVLLGDGRFVLTAAIRRCTPDDAVFVLGLEVLGGEQVPDLDRLGDPLHRTLAAPEGVSERE